MNFFKAKEFLSHRLKSPLPGTDAQYLLAPVRRKSFDDFIKEYPDHRKSAVMILVFPGEENTATMLLIERPQGDHVHSGQIALPGGRIEEPETAEDAAKRETEEEVGIAANKIIVSGMLTELFIPASKFIVQPFVGTIDFTPEFIPSPYEVQSLILVSMQELIASPVLQQSFETSYGKIVAPYFNIGGHAVWGATAMILSEFRELMK